MSPFHRVGGIIRFSKKGYGRKSLHGHRHAFSLDVQKVLKALPKKPDESLYRLLLTGCYTSEEVVKILETTQVNPEH